MIQLWTLGALELRAGGAEVRSVLNQPKRLALLAYLALHRPHGFVSRESVLAMFWPEQDEERGRSALNRAIYYLRRALGGDVILSRGDEIGISGTELWCDALAFRKAATELRCGQAIELYRGDLLAGFHVSDANGFEEWLEPERIALRKLAHDCAWSLAQTEEQAGNYAAAAQHAAWACEREPYNESTVQRRMLLLDRIGDRAGAVRVFEQFTLRLAAELDLEPAPETRAILESVRERADVSANHLQVSNGAQNRQPPEPGLPAHRASEAKTIERALPRRHVRVVASLVFACVLAALAVAAFLLRPGRHVTDERIVFIAPIENHTGDAALDAAALAATSWITRRVTDAIESSAAATYAASGRVLGFDSTQPESGQHAAVRVAGGLYRDRVGLRFDVRVIDAVRGEKAWVIPAITTRSDTVDRAIHELGERAAGAVVALLSDTTGTWFPVATAPPTLDAVIEFLRATQLHFVWEAGPNYERAAQIDSSFTLALLYAAFAQLGTNRVRSQEITTSLDLRRGDLTLLQNHVLDWLIAEQANNRKAAYDALARAAAIAPKQFTSQLAFSATLLNRPHETLRILDRLDQLRPQQHVPSTWVMRTLQHHALGEYEKEETLALQARKAQPSQLDGLYVETRALAGLRRVHAVNALIDSALSYPIEGRYTPGNVMQIAAEELRAHGESAASAEIASRAVQWYRNAPAQESDPSIHEWILAELLYLAGHWEEARILATKLAATPTPYRAFFYGRLGAIAARTGDRTAAHHYLTLLDQLSVADGTPDEVFLARARISALLGDADAALNYLRNAKGAQGTEDLHTDIDFESMRSNPAYREFTRPKG